MRQQQETELVSGLRTAISRLVKKVRSESTAGDGLSLTERITLSTILQHRQLLPSQLSAIEKVSSQLMSQILKHLDELGYITKTGSQEDKRKTIIAITEKGKEVIQRSRHEKEEWMAKAIRATLSKEERATLGEAINLLIRLADFE